MIWQKTYFVAFFRAQFMAISFTSWKNGKFTENKL